MTREQKLNDLREHPENHKHLNLDELSNCCMINGALDLMLMELHPAQGYNGGQKCDVMEGPCSCGAWH